MACPYGWQKCLYPSERAGVETNFSPLPLGEIGESCEKNLNPLPLGEGGERSEPGEGR